ncbi:MAG TPA: hypothetical protein VKU00_11735, partial [Chthonomonadaceae bacterium]|nr:hypothetical protein [Chthonomonadaceae bacterium]
MIRAFPTPGILVGLILGYVLILLPASAQKPDPAIMKGELKLGSQTIPLRYAYAQDRDDVEGIRLQGWPKKSTLLLFTDTALPADAVGNLFRCIALARAGKLNGVEIDLDTTTGKMYAGTIYHNMGADQPPNLSISVTGDTDTYQFKDLKLGPDVVSGTALMTKAEEWPSLDPNAKPTPFQFTTEFRMALTHQPAVTANLTGAAAQGS